MSFAVLITAEDRGHSHTIMHLAEVHQPLVRQFEAMGLALGNWLYPSAARVLSTRRLSASPDPHRLNTPAAR